jgi:hypothetical protein
MKFFIVLLSSQDFLFSLTTLPWNSPHFTATFTVLILPPSRFVKNNDATPLKAHPFISTLIGLPVVC